MKEARLEALKRRIAIIGRTAEKILEGHSDNYDGADGAREVLDLCDICDELSAAIVPERE
jgi:hypothetical protein